MLDRPGVAVKRQLKHLVRHQGEQVDLFAFLASGHLHRTVGPDLGGALDCNEKSTEPLMRALIRDADMASSRVT